ncbi:tRNA (guanine37-N1)-methyltransferase [Pancytospora philotis]|nr:tRNA (guanine37-N1)-methyltransferase [Pancytospora philotis]
MDVAAAPTDAPVVFRAIGIPMADMQAALSAAAPYIRKVPRIPSIILKAKAYRAFELQNASADAYILLVDSAPDVVGGRAVTTVALRFGDEYYTYTELLQRVMPADLVPGSYEIIGAVIHLNLSEAQLPYKQVIGEVLHAKTGLTVINKTGRIDNVYRFYQFEVLAGSGLLQTVHTENGVKIYLDLERVYWCSRLQTEREAITKMVGKDEALCDPFCGAGPQVLPVLKKGAVVYANDLNPAAIDCLKRSLRLNKLACDSIGNTDAGEFIRSLVGKRIDHFVFNLPEYSLNFVQHLRPFSGYRLHCFFFCRVDQEPAAVVLDRTGYSVKPAWLRMVRMVSPSKAVYKLEVLGAELNAFQKCSANL